MENKYSNYVTEQDTVRDSKYIIRKNGVRISVITSRLIRIEIQNSSVFTDEATQTVVNRNFDSPFYNEFNDKDTVIINTSDVVFEFSYKSKSMKSITINGQKITDFNKGNLKGTRRTLDFTNGKTKLSDGILSKNGITVLDDSDSLLIKSNGSIVPRKCKETDLYFFAYGNDYFEALKDYYKLTGNTPLIPRYALGNWWSRYKAYTSEEYLNLIKRFEKDKIPLSVATIDMDWHWVDVVEKFGEDTKEKLKGKQFTELFYNITSPGWTGYSWNTDLFPNPKEFLKELKERKLKITLNIHPASGCRYFEDNYNEFAEYMGIDPKSKKQIPFDVTNEKFIEGYFRYLHHPHEADGVDFWWIDWQQGTKSGIKGLDPLWALNHYHFIDNSDNNRRPLILSRFAGAGSHRYPLGFSGDSSQTWETLNFQPEFTATASNIGYSWWSHDIGGHHLGKRDDELYLRWVQFGVFSPVMRLHSTSNEFMGKEPWKYRESVHQCVKEYMQFRHRLIPYLYTMNAKCHFEGIPLIRPLYYYHPNEEKSYRYPNEYYFGDELIVCPITAPINKKTGLASVKIYLPSGRYTDIFSDRIYEGNQEIELFRDENSIPVLAREGAIIPLNKDCTENGVENPENIELLVFRGNSSFELYEDDGISMDYKNGKYVRSKFTVNEENDSVVFRIYNSEDKYNIIPFKRNYTVSFRDIESAEEIQLIRNSNAENPVYDISKGYLQVNICGHCTDDFDEIILKNIKIRHSPEKREIKIELISKLQKINDFKSKYLKSLVDTNNLSENDLLYLPLKEIDKLY